MLVSAIRRCVLCNLRRTAACFTYRNKTRMKIAQQCSESNLLSISSPNIAAYRISSTESDAEPQDALPMLVTAKMFTLSFLNLFRFFPLYFKIILHVDKEFVMHDILEGIQYAITVISKALASKDYDSLEGLVAEDMIEVLKTKIETLNPEQQQLIAVDEETRIFHVLNDMTVVTDKEHSIEFKMILYYMPAKKTKWLETATFLDIFYLKDFLVCNYTFTRKYVNNVGGPWIATFVNHYSIHV